jgi:hypothetical protein
MVIFVITQQLPPVLVVALGIVVYLTALWNEDEMPLLVKAFWVLFVFLGHVFGYGIFRAWLALHRRGRGEGARP